MKAMDPFDLQLKAIIARYSQDARNTRPGARGARLKWYEETWHPTVVDLAKRTLAKYRKWPTSERGLLKGVRVWDYWNSHLPHVPGPKYDHYNEIDLFEPSKLMNNPRILHRTLVREATKATMYRLAALWGIEEATSLKEQVADAVINTSGLNGVLFLSEDDIRALILETADEVAADVRETVG